MAPDDCAIDSEWLKTDHVNSEGVRKAGKCICKGASHGKYCQIRKFACGDRSRSFFFALFIHGSQSNTELRPNAYPAFSPGDGSVSSEEKTFPVIC